MKTLNYISSQAPNRTILYARWNSMRNRCYNKNNPAYKHYGGRGIKVCDEWNKCPYGFVAFYAWAMQNGFKHTLSIERDDVNGNYEPSNCRWIPFAEQALNRTNTIKIWDNDRYIPLLTYCTKHEMKKEYNSIRGLIQDFGIPPYIAMYHNIHSRNIEDWLEKHQNELLIIMHEILCEHTNLIEDTSIPLLTYIRQYLAKY